MNDAPRGARTKQAPILSCAALAAHSLLVVNLLSLLLPAPVNPSSPAPREGGGEGADEAAEEGLRLGGRAITALQLGGAHASCDRGVQRGPGRARAPGIEEA